MAGMLIQQEKTNDMLQNKQENMSTTQAFNNAFIAILDKFQRVEEKQDHRWTQLVGET